MATEAPEKMSKRLAEIPGLEGALNELSQKFTNQKMRELNYKVDGEHRSAPQVAAEFLHAFIIVMIRKKGLAGTSPFFYLITIFTGADKPDHVGIFASFNFVATYM